MLKRVFGQDGGVESGALERVHQDGANTASQAKRVSLWLAGAGGIAAIAVIAVGGFMLAGSFFPGASWAVLSVSIGSFPVSIVVLSASLVGAPLFLTIFFSLLCQKTKSNAKNDDRPSENPVGVTGIASSKASETGEGKPAEGEVDSASGSDTKTAVSEDSDTDTKTAVSEDSDTDTKTAVSEDSDTDTKTAVSEDSDTDTKTAVSEDSDTDTKTAVSEDSDTDTKTAVSEDSDTDTKTAVSEDSDTDTKTAVSEDSDTGTKTVVEQGEVNKSKVNISAGTSDPKSIRPNSISLFDTFATQATIIFSKTEVQAPKLSTKFTIAWDALTKPRMSPLHPSDRKKYAKQALEELEKCNQERQEKGFKIHPKTEEYMQVLSPSVKS